MTSPLFVSRVMSALEPRRHSQGSAAWGLPTKVSAAGGVSYRKHYRLNHAEVLYEAAMKNRADSEFSGQDLNEMNCVIADELAEHESGGHWPASDSPFDAYSSAISMRDFQARVVTWFHPDDSFRAFDSLSADSRRLWGEQVQRLRAKLVASWEPDIFLTAALNATAQRLESTAQVVRTGAPSRSLRDVLEGPAIERQRASALMFGNWTGYRILRALSEPVARLGASELAASLGEEFNLVAASSAVLHQAGLVDVTTAGFALTSAGDEIVVRLARLTES